MDKNVGYQMDLNEVKLLAKVTELLRWARNVLILPWSPS